MSKPDKRPVHVAEIKKTCKGKVRVLTYLRRTFRQDGKVKHETVPGISDLPDDLLIVIKNRLTSGQPLVGSGGNMTIERSLPHGNVAAVLGTMRNIGLDDLMASRPCREKRLVMAMIAARILSPSSKLSYSTGMHPKTTQNTLGEELQLSEVNVHKLYDAMDWLLKRQTCIENKLAKKHSKDGALLLFDVSSSSDTADPKTFTHIVAHIRRRFDITNVVFVGDRRMITTKRIEEDLRDLNGLDWISAFHTEGLRSLVDAGKIRHSLFD